MTAVTDTPDAAARIARGLEALTEWSAALRWSDVPEPIRRRAAVVGVRLIQALQGMVGQRVEHCLSGAL